MGAEAEIFGYTDELGPEKVVHFYDPKLQLKGILVVDNTAHDAQSNPISGSV